MLHCRLTTSGLVFYMQALKGNGMKLKLLIISTFFLTFWISCAVKKRGVSHLDYFCESAHRKLNAYTDPEFKQIELGRLFGHYLRIFGDSERRDGHLRRYEIFKVTCNGNCASFSALKARTNQAKSEEILRKVKKKHLLKGRGNQSFLYRGYLFFCDRLPFNGDKHFLVIGEGEKKK